MASPPPSTQPIPEQPGIFRRFTNYIAQIRDRVAMPPVMSPEKAKNLAVYIARNLSPEEARQLSPYIPDNWFDDKHITPEAEKPISSGYGYVMSPYSSWTTRQWGVQPNKDLPIYVEMYRTVPVIRKAIDKTAILSVTKGYDYEVTKENPLHDEIIECCRSFWDREDVNQIEYLTTAAKDLLIFGYHMSELVYEDYSASAGKDIYGQPVTWIKPDGELLWLKPLDPQFMRVQRDSYGNQHGFLQYLIAPPQAFTNEKIAYFKYSPWSVAYENTYGTSLLMSLLRTQNMIWQMEADLLVMAHAGAKPPMWFKGGTPVTPYTDIQMNQLVASTAARGPGSDIYTRSNVDGMPLPQPSTMIQGLMEHLKYLHDQRIILLGVPPQILGIPEGSTRTTAQVADADFIIVLQTIQQIIGEGLRYQVYARRLRAKFGADVEIPKLKWRDVYSEDRDKKVYRAIALYKNAAITLNELRLDLGYHPIDDDPTADEIPPKPAPSMGNGMPFGGSVQYHAQVESEWLETVRLAKVGVRDEFTIYIIDHKAVSTIDPRWNAPGERVVGNHHWGQIGWYIPADEIWISDVLPESERQAVIQHEYVEAILLKGGVKYQDAHEIAKTEEAKVGEGQILTRPEAKAVASLNHNHDHEHPASYSAAKGKKKRPNDKRLRELETVVKNQLIKNFLKPRLDEVIERSKTETFPGSPIKASTDMGKWIAQERDDPKAEAIRKSFFEAIQLGKGKAELDNGLSFDFKDPELYDMTDESFSYIYKYDQDLANSLNEAIRESKSWSEVADKIRDEVEPTYENRAETIAISELAFTSNVGYHNAVDKSGLTGRYIFHNSADELVCDECEMLEGTEYNEMRYPHPRCRCYIEFEPDT